MPVKARRARPARVEVADADRELDLGFDPEIDRGERALLGKLNKVDKTAITGNGFRDLIAAYIHHQYGAHGLVVYREVNLGKTIIAKDRQIDVFVMRPQDQK